MAESQPIRNLFNPHGRIQPKYLTQRSPKFEAEVPRPAVFLAELAPPLRRACIRPYRRNESALFVQIDIIVNNPSFFDQQRSLANLNVGVYFEGNAGNRKHGEGRFPPPPRLRSRFLAS